MRQDRRTFLVTLGAAAIGQVLRPDIVRAASNAGRGATLDRVGLQLYTVRSLMQQDVTATLESVAAIGYTAVEFAGYFNRTPAQIADLLRSNRLASPSTHIGFDVMRDAWPRALETAAAIGHTWVTIPHIDARTRQTLDDWKRVAELFNQRATEARAAGLRFAYHNHDFEFARIDDVVPFDILIEQTEPGLVDFQLDIYWITKAGFDPLLYFERFPGRWTMTHLKDSGGPPDHRMTEVGSGTIDFARVIAAADDAGVQHHFVEHDQPADALASIRTSYQNLTRLRT